MQYRLARALQLIGLVLVPVAVAGNLAELAGAPTSLKLWPSLLLSGLGIAIFYVGWWLQQKNPRS